MVEIIWRHILTFLHMMPGSFGDMKPSSQIPPTEKFLLMLVINTFNCYRSMRFRKNHLLSLLEWKRSVGLFFQRYCVVDGFEGVEELSLSLEDLKHKRWHQQHTYHSLHLQMLGGSKKISLEKERLAESRHILFQLRPHTPEKAEIICLVQIH